MFLITQITASPNFIEAEHIRDIIHLYSLSTAKCYFPTITAM